MNILEVFTKEYQEETKYREFLGNNIDSFKLEAACYDIEKRISAMKESDFESNFKGVMTKEKTNEKVKVFNKVNN